MATVADRGDLPADAVQPMLEVIADGLLRQAASEPTTRGRLGAGPGPPTDYR